KTFDSVVNRPLSVRGRELLSRCLEQEQQFESVGSFREEMALAKDDRLDISGVRIFVRVKHLLAQALFLVAPVMVAGIFFSLGFLLPSRRASLGIYFLQALTIPGIFLAWIFITRGGYALHGSGLVIARTNGARASRLRITFRAALVILPFLAITYGLKFLYPSHVGGDLARLTRTFVFVLAAVFFVLALLYPRRGLHDVIADTTLAPR
ncbi:MAG: hypothetical protein VB855_13455, partial [Pirellulaceae bacterium]